MISSKDVHVPRRRALRYIGPGRRQLPRVGNSLVSVTVFVARNNTTTPPPTDVATCGARTGSTSRRSDRTDAPTTAASRKRLATSLRPPIDFCRRLSSVRNCACSEVTRSVRAPGNRNRVGTTRPTPAWPWIDGASAVEAAKVIVVAVIFVTQRRIPGPEAEPPSVVARAICVTSAVALGVLVVLVCMSGVAQRDRLALVGTSRWPPVGKNLMAADTVPRPVLKPTGQSTSPTTQNPGREKDGVRGRSLRASSAEVPVPHGFLDKSVRRCRSGVMPVDAFSGCRQQRRHHEMDGETDAIPGIHAG